MNHGSLFSGIGGFDLAAQWMGWENVFHCELNPFGRKILKHYWPESISYEDITKTDFTIHRGQIDILTGGFPCQPYSQAGKRLGKEDDRHLWPEMLRAIRELAPRYIVGENVYGLVNWNGGLVFNEVQTDLEAEGHEVQPIILPACAVNAPHRRDRVWFVAWNAKSAREAEEREVQRGQNTVPDRVRGTIRNTFISNGGEPTTPNTQDIHWFVAYSIGERWERGERLCYESRKKQRERGAAIAGASLQDKRATPNTDLSRSKRKGKQPITTTQIRISNSGDNWNNFPTQSPICGRDDGVSDRLDGITFPKWRNESIKAYGNAIVPQVVYQIFKAINESKRVGMFEDYESSKTCKE